MDVVVKAPCGSLEGVRVQSGNGMCQFLSFRGIPYAKPPVHELRFAHPQPLPTWQGLKPAKRYANDCVQWDPTSKSVIGSEDCLYLNVFTRAQNQDDRLPVIFWIHGGAFNFGSGSGLLYGPHRAMNEHVVLVTCNYRLGPLGFLANNAGLLDQQLALKWTDRNISAFGGDPRNVTLMGESAGAASAHFHLLAPGSKGFFHKLILQSGNAFSPWAWQDKKEALASVRALTEELGCQKVSQLKKISAKDLVVAGQRILNSIQTQIFVPCEERKATFLPYTYHILLQRKWFPQNVPIIMGVNANEGAFMAALLLASKSTTRKLNDEEDEALPDLFHLRGPHRFQNARRIRHRYFGQSPIDWSTVHQLSAAISDESFVYPFCKAAKAHAGNPLWLYKYSHRGQFTLPQLLGYTGTEDLGVSHFDEVILQFSNKLLPSPESNSPDDHLSKMMWTAWAKFARDGKPLLNSKGNLPLEWPISQGTKDDEDPVQHQHVDLTVTPTVKDGLADRNVNFWDLVEKSRPCKL